MKRLFCFFVLALCAQLCYADESVAGHQLGSYSQFVTWLVSTFAILAVIFLFAFLLKKTRFVKSNTGKLVLLNQLYLGQKQRLAIIKAENRKLLIGISAGQITTLAELDDDKEQFDAAIREQQVLHEHQEHKTHDESNQN
ncbi:MAG: FliO/MopB family protein [Succinivibrio sp.]